MKEKEQEDYKGFWMYFGKILSVIAFVSFFYVINFFWRVFNDPVTLFIEKLLDK